MNGRRVGLLGVAMTVAGLSLLGISTIVPPAIGGLTQPGWSGAGMVGGGWSGSCPR